MIGEKSEEDIQKRFYMYQILKNQQELFSQQLVLIEQGIEDLLATEEVLKELEKIGDRNIIVTLGKECFTRAEIKDKNKILVDLGAGVLAGKPLKDALKIIKSRREELGKNSRELALRLERINSELAKIEPDIQKTLEKN